jgi:uncharacterized protein (DUF58 family)
MFPKLATIPPESTRRSMWKNFSQSMTLLGVAMVAALYSSSAGRDGRVIAAGVSALLALGLAVWVALRFVPSLAQGVDWDWLPFRSHYEITRGGWVYAAAVATVVLAAVNTSNNLLYMVLAALLAVLVLSGFLCALNFRFLRFDLRLPATCFAGEPFPFSIQIRNQRNVFPAFSLQAGPVSGSPMRFEPLYFPLILADTQSGQAGTARFLRRGRYDISELRGTSRYPFGFFTRSRKYDVMSECVCFPAIVPQEKIDFAGLDDQGSIERFEKGLGFDLHTIRDYVQSDSARHVHWKASAKTAALKTREYAAEESHRVLIGFDRFGGPGDTDDFERQVAYAASLVFYLIRDGIEVAFVSDDWRTEQTAPASLLEPILSYLATVEMSPNAVTPHVDPGSAGVLLSLRR